MYLHNKTKPQQLGFSHDGIHGFFGRFLAKFQGADFGRLVRSPKFHEFFLLCRGVFCPGKKNTWCEKWSEVRKQSGSYELKDKFPDLRCF